VANASYRGQVSFGNETGSIDAEIVQEGADHQVFYQAAGGLNMAFSYNDTDILNQPLGLMTELTTGAAGSGQLTGSARTTSPRPYGSQIKNQASNLLRLPSPEERSRGRGDRRESPSCSITLSGRLLSEHDSELLAYATIYGQAAERGIQADSAGNFFFTGLCAGKQTFTFTHIGCDGESLTLNLQRDTQITIYLHHHDNYTETVTVSAAANAGYSRELDERAPDQLSDALERITGVSSLRAGTSAAKPVYDGVFGNRLSLQNNGIAQSGQQWGNDHAPEIDPWVAAYVRVVEGVEALKYAGPTVAATVLIEPAPLREDEAAAGKVAYGYHANGRGHNLNARFSKGGRLAYRFSASGKFSGDQRAPDYYLANTGRREGNAALQLPTQFAQAERKPSPRQGGDGVSAKRRPPFHLSLRRPVERPERV